MDRILLVTPGPAHEAEAMAYVAEHRAAGEDSLHGSGGLELAPTYAGWLDLLARAASEDTVPEGRVPASTFFGVREGDGRIVGVIDLRHRLNDALRQGGGHIGYGVRPGERRKGYAGQMLAQALEAARGLGLDRVMISCAASNEASRRTILAAGGVLERETVDSGGRPQQLYWIELG